MPPKDEKDNQGRKQQLQDAADAADELANSLEENGDTANAEKARKLRDDIRLMGSSWY